MQWWFRLFRRPSDNEFATELEAHVAHATDEHRERGLPPDEARYAALRAFGNLTQHRERFREASLWFWLETLRQDVRHGWRSLWRTPILTSVVILSLALGVGANTAILTAARTLLLVPLRLPEPDRVFFLTLKDERRVKDIALSGGVPYGYRHQISGMFSPIGTGGHWHTIFQTIHYKAQASTALVMFATEGAVGALGFSPRLGRWPSASEHRTGASVAVLTDWFWRERCGGAPDILGQRVRLDETPFTIIGVAPPGFAGLGPTGSYAAIVPFTGLKPAWLGPANSFSVIGRLARGVSARAAADRIAGWRLERVPKAHEWAPGAGAAEFLPHVELVTPRDILVPPEQQKLLATVLGGLQGIAGLVLLLGCTNLAAAMLARSAVRRREMAMRITLGASHGRLARTMAVEFVLLAVVSGAGGIAASSGLLSLVRPGLEAHFDPSGTVHTAFEFRADEVALAFALLTSLLTCALFGATPVMRLLRVDPITALRTGGERQTATSRWQRGLVGVQVAASSMLLISALLFAGSVRRALGVNLGYAAEHLLVAAVSLPWPQYDVPRSTRVRQEIVTRLTQHPEIAAAAFASNGSPFVDGPWSWRTAFEFTIDGVAHAPLQSSRPYTGFAGVESGLLLVAVDESYRSTLGLPLLAGRDFSLADGPTSEPVALINEAMARRYWSGASALESRVRLKLSPGEHQMPVPQEGTLRIVGVVGNARFDVKRGTAPCIYIPRTQFVYDQAGGGLLYVRGRSSNASAAAWMQAAIQRAVPDEPMPAVHSVEERMETLLAPELLATRLLWWFAGVAIALSILGIYGVTAHHVSRHTREIAIRLAIGAPSRAIVRMVGGIAMMPVLAGVLLGCAALIALAPAFRAFLFEVSPLDSWFYGAGTGLLIAVATVAAWVPARGATRIDPAVTLRAE